MNKLDFKHIIGLMVGVTVTLIATQAYEVIFKSDVSHAQIQNTFKEEINELSKNMALEISQDRSRISALETDSKNINNWMTRIEGKLDRVIAR